MVHSILYNICTIPLNTRLAGFLFERTRKNASNSAYARSALHSDDPIKYLNCELWQLLSPPRVATCNLQVVCIAQESQESLLMRRSVNVMDCNPRLITTTTCIKL